MIEGWPLPHRDERDRRAEPSRTCTCFEHNLRKVGDWTDEASLRITAAYRKFLYLKAQSGETLTPPEWIDDAWHLHLEFPGDYSALETAVGRPLSHRRGLTRDESRQAYQRGWQLWSTEFDAEPPADLWPTLEHLRADRIGKAVAVLGFCIWIAGLAVYSLDGPLDWPAIVFFFTTGYLLGVWGFLIAGAQTSPQTMSHCG